MVEARRRNIQVIDRCESYHLSPVMKAFPIFSGQCSDRNGFCTCYLQQNVSAQRGKVSNLYRSVTAVESFRLWPLQDNLRLDPVYNPNGAFATESH